MSNTAALIITGLVVMLTNAIEGVTGFGSAVIALPFLNFTVGLHLAVKSLCFFGWLVPIYIIARSYKHINWRDFGSILLWCAPGVPVGMLLFGLLPAAYLCVLLGAFMVYVGVSGWRGMKRKAGGYDPELARRSKLLKLSLFCGGVIQGAFGTGGPFVVIYAAKALPDKSLFRVTLIMLWLVINSSRMAAWLVRGELSDPMLWKIILISFPFWAAGLLLGDYLHNRASEYHFKLGVYLLIGVSGVVMFLNNLRLIFG